MLEGLKKCEEDLLDVPSYSEPLGEAILQRMHKLKSKQRLPQPWLYHCRRPCWLSWLMESYSEFHNHIR